MSDIHPRRAPVPIVWPQRLKRTPTRALWFDRIRSLPPGLDLQSISRMFKVTRTTAHLWVKTFGYAAPDRRKSPKSKTVQRGAKRRRAKPNPVSRTFEALAEDGSRHVVLATYPAESAGAGKPRANPVLTTSGKQQLYRVAKGIYQFVATGQRLMSKDRAAP